ncbi:MAG: hypothetical protein NC489_09085 [Ruminococcus flavefaciens]|nr:hypothetical protein [Ruminococcus flavefaciens]
MEQNTMKKSYALLEVLTEENISTFVLQDTTGLNIVAALDNYEELAQLLSTSEKDIREDVERIYTVAGVGGKRVLVPHPQKVVHFCNKYRIHLRPSVYNDMCSYYCQTVYLKDPMFSQESMHQMKVSCEGKELDMFPAPCDFPKTADLLEAFSETYVEGN